MPPVSGAGSARRGPLHRLVGLLVDVSEDPCVSVLRPTYGADFVFEREEDAPVVRNRAVQTAAGAALAVVKVEPLGSVPREVVPLDLTLDAGLPRIGQRATVAVTVVVGVNLGRLPPVEPLRRRTGPPAGSL